MQSAHRGCPHGFLEAFPVAQRRVAATVAAGLLSVESFTHALEPPPPETLAALAVLCDVLSPNELEARSMLGAAAAAAPAPDLAKRLLAAGAPCIGSLPCSLTTLTLVLWCLRTAAFPSRARAGCCAM